MVNIRNTIESLHRLVLVNNDRVKWYQKAIADIRDIEPSLTELFQTFAQESHSYAQELDEKIRLLGTGDGIDSTTLGGKAFRVWSDLKSVIYDNPVESVLSSSEHVEDRVQEAYQKAIKESESMDESSVYMLLQHQMILKDMHDQVKAYRDESKLD